MTKKDNNSKLNFATTEDIAYEDFKNMSKYDNKTRENKIKDWTKSEISKGDLTKICKMSFIEEFTVCLLFLFGVPGAVFSIPILLAIIGYYIDSYKKSYGIGLLLCIPLIIFPSPFKDSSLSSWFSFLVVKYFSFKGIYVDKIEPHKPYILVAPPHGVFPIGNICTMISFPTIFGFSFKGLAASAALRLPIFKQILCSIGAIDASRDSAEKALLDNYTIGISTGGVAEIFETNSISGDEVIVLRNRKGIIKLAFKTGASLVPCYLFGNTHLYSLWTGTGAVHELLRNLSRKIGAALIIFWGRNLMPIPYRIPIVGVMAKPIPVIKNDNPTEKDIEDLHELLIDEMIKLFDKHKESYGWKSKKLIVI
jgi:2-acylglycerol O-acyltransferase 2